MNKWPQFWKDTSLHLATEINLCKWKQDPARFPAPMFCNGLQTPVMYIKSNFYFFLHKILFQESKAAKSVTPEKELSLRRTSGHLKY